MNQHEKLEHAVSMVKQAKTAGLAKAWAENDLGYADLHPMGVGYRDGEAVALLVAHTTSADEALKVSFILSVYFSCETVVLNTEGWQAKTLENPITGKEWEKGDMQDVAQNHDGLAKGIIQEAMTTVLVNRDQSYEVCISNFLVKKDTEPWSVEWQEQWASEGFEGRVVESMKLHMRHKNLWDQAHEDGIAAMKASEGLTEVEKRAHMDCAVVKGLSDKSGRGWAWQGAVMLIGSETETERQRIIDQSLGHLPGVVPEHKLDEWGDSKD